MAAAAFSSSTVITISNTVDLLRSELYENPISNASFNGITPVMNCRKENEDILSMQREYIPNSNNDIYNLSYINSTNRFSIFDENLQNIVEYKVNRETYADINDELFENILSKKINDFIELYGLSFADISYPRRMIDEIITIMKNNLISKKKA